MSKVEKKVFDVLTAKKIIGDYADKLNYYMKDNQNLKNLIEDLKMTLKINKDLLFKYISTNVQKTEQITFLNDYKNDNLKLQEKNEKLHHDKVTLEKKLYRYQQDFQDDSMKIREQMEQLREEIFVLKNKLNEKDNNISLIKNNLDKSTSSNKQSVKDLPISVYITEPTKVNLELNNELSLTREMISKVTRMLNQEKVKNEKLEAKFGVINEELANIKKKIPSNNNSEITTIKLKPMKTDSDSFLSDSDLDFTLDEMSIDSGDIKFPDKANYNSSYICSLSASSPIKLNLERKKSCSVVPKLDFKIIQTKYMTEAIKAPAIDLKKTFGIGGKSQPQDEASKLIEKLKSDLKESMQNVKDLTSKLENYKNAYLELKKKFKTVNENLKIYKFKISHLEGQNKRMSINPSTDDLSNKRVNVTNCSMVKYFFNLPKE